MTIKKLMIAGAVLLVALISFNAQSDWWPFSKDEDDNAIPIEVVEIDWQDLIPDDFVQPENPFDSMTQDEIDKILDGSEESNAELARLEEAFFYAPVNSEMDGKQVKLPGYVTPLEFDGQTKMKEFLFVPYVGACMHTPPPPANQIVHVQSPETVEIPGIRIPIWVVGTIHTETVESALAESGYRMDIDKILPYEIPEQQSQ